MFYDFKNRSNRFLQCETTYRLHAVSIIFASCTFAWATLVAEQHLPNINLTNKNSFARSCGAPF
jgi:hypothetical protein